MKDKNMKLKTLNDIGNPNDEIFNPIKDVIKAEAVKWVKHIESGEEVDCGKVRFSWDKKSQWTGASGQVLTEWIKHFFNITENDLK